MAADSIIQESWNFITTFHSFSKLLLCRRQIYRANTQRRRLSLPSVKSDILILEEIVTRISAHVQLNSNFGDAPPFYQVRIVEEKSSIWYLIRSFRAVNKYLIKQWTNQAALEPTYVDYEIPYIK